MWRAFVWLCVETPMLLRKLIAVAAAGFLGIALAQVDAVAHGSRGSPGSLGPAGSPGAHGYFHASYSHGFAREGRHGTRDHHWTMHGFGPWDAHGAASHWRHFDPGHWQVASGFGNGARWSYAEGVWHR
jgi:hypothetical protein